MKNIKYLVLVETGDSESERTAFITELFDTTENADKFAEELWSLAKVFCNRIIDKYGTSTICAPDKLENIVNILKRKNYPSYSLKGQKQYLGKGGYFTTNEALEISIVEVDVNKYSLKSFIYEHQNLTSIFNWIEESDENKYRPYGFAHFNFTVN